MTTVQYVHYDIYALLNESARKESPISHIRKTKVQISLHICTVLSGPLLQNIVIYKGGIRCSGHSLVRRLELKLKVSESSSARVTTVTVYANIPLVMS